MDTLKYLVELVGTFLFVYVILNVSNGSAGFTKDPTLGAVTIVLTLLAVIFAFGNISGGNFNPAVSVAKMMDGALDMNTFAAYIVMQVVGAAAAVKFWQLTTGKSV